MIPTIQQCGKGKNYDNTQYQNVYLLPRAWRETRDKQSTEDFQGSEYILYDATMVDIRHSTLVKTNGSTIQRVRPM